MKACNIISVYHNNDGETTVKTTTLRVTTALSLKGRKKAKEGCDAKSTCLETNTFACIACGRISETHLWSHKQEAPLETR